MRNRSLQESSRTSAGIMSPADKFHHVAGDQVAEGNLRALAVAEDGGGDADHRLELGGGGVGPGLLDEPQDDAEDHHHGHHDAGPQVAGQQ